MIGDAVSEAKKRRGNAIIIRYGSEFGVGGTIGAADDPSVWSQNQGTAPATLKEGVLTIVSTQGPAEVTFSGSFDKGRLTGKMGIGATSINCDGVGSKEKISLSGRGQVADGTIQANLVFLR